jgi:hypothetical protein
MRRRLSPRVFAFNFFKPLDFDFRKSHFFFFRKKFLSLKEKPKFFENFFSKFRKKISFRKIFNKRDLRIFFLPRKFSLRARDIFIILSFSIIFYVFIIIYGF